MNNITSVADFRGLEKYFQSIIVKSRKINRERIEPNAMNRGKYRNARQLPGTNRDEDLSKRAEAGRLRGATTTAPHRSDQPNTAATYDIHQLCTTVTEDLHICRERESKRGRGKTTNHHCKKKNITIDSYVLISTHG